MPNQPLTRRLIPIDQAAEYTGLSKHTLYTMVSQRRIPYVKMGRLTKFDVALLDAWIKQNTVMPMPPKAKFDVALLDAWIKQNTVMPMPPKGT